ncbi:MAG: efflux RND transporter periplasmic adaptor subunit [Flavobacteriaceae bacterium]
MKKNIHPSTTFVLVMKKTTILFCLIALLAACSDNKEVSTTALIDQGNLEVLLERKASLTQNLNQLKIEINQINEALDTLDSSRRFPLVTSFEVESGTFNHYIELQGDIKTRKNVTLFPEIPGTLVRFEVREGQRVKKGQVLARIDDGGMRNQLEQLQLQKQLAQTTFERVQRLWDQKIGSEMQYLEAQTRYKSLEQNVAQVRSQLDKAIIEAPFTGVIDELIANAGSIVSPGASPVLRLVNLDEMYLEAQVPEKFLPSIKEGTPTVVEIPMLGTSLQTQIRQTGNFINPGNRTFRIEAPLDNPEGFIKPNLTAKLQVNDYSNPEALVVPLSIVNENAAGQSFVFRMQKTPEADVFITEQVFITLGQSNEKEVEVLSGIQVGDLLIQEGASIVESQQRVRRIQS